MLALHANETVSSDRLVDGLWGDEPPATAPKMVQLYVSQLRRLIATDDATIVTHGRGYELRVPDEAVDVARFERLVEEAGRRNGTTDGAAREALALWRGAALADVGGEPFAGPEIRRLNELRLRAAELAVDGDLAAGRYEEALAELERLIDEHPLRERLHAQRMLALYRSGRQAEALEAYVAARRRLVDDAGIEPSAELRDLHDRILRQDPSLQIPPARAETHVVGEERARRLAAAPATRARHSRYALIAAAAAAAVVVAAILAVQGLSGTDVLPGIDENAVGVIDPDEAGVIAQYGVGAGPGAIAVGGGSVWVANAQDGTVSRIDRERDEVVTIPVGEQPGGLAYGSGSLFVTIPSERSVAQVSPRSNRVVRTIDVANSPQGIAGGFGAMWVASQVDRTVSRLDLAGRTSARTIHVAASPTALVSGAGALWVTSEEGGTVLRIEPRTRTVLKSIPVGDGPVAIAVGAGAVWVANRQASTVSRIDPATNRVTHTVPVDGEPTAIAADARGVWVASGARATVTRIDPATRQPAESVHVRSIPSALAVVDGSIWTAALASRQSHRGGTLRVELGAPSYDSLEPGNYDINPLLGLAYDSLVSFRRTGGATFGPLVGNLATEVPEPSPDGLTYVFSLRPGVRYSNGRLVQPEDFRASMQDLIGRFKDLAPIWNAIIGVPKCQISKARCDLSRGIVTDARARTVTVRLREPDSELLYKLATDLTSVAPADHPFGSPTQPPGTGPYRIASYDRHRGARLVRNPRFRVWSADARPDALPDEILVRFHASLDASAATVQRGKSDVVVVRDVFGGGLSPDRLTSLVTRNQGQLFTSAAPELDFAFLNVGTPPFDDVRVRRAVNYAVDRRLIAELAGGRDLAQPTCQIGSPGFPGYKARCRYTVDPGPGGEWVGPDLARARRLIARSGTRGMKVTVWGYREKIALHEYLVQLLESLGYRSSLRLFPDYGAWAEAVHDTRNDPQIGIDGWVVDFPVPSNFTPPVSCALHTPHLRQTDNLSRFCDRAIEARMRAALQARGSRGLTLWHDVYRRFEDAAPIIPLVNRRTVVLTSDRVRNFQHHPLWGTLYDQLSVR